VSLPNHNTLNRHGGMSDHSWVSWLGCKSPTDQDRASEALIRYGPSSWSAHWNRDTYEYAGAPEFFHGKVPSDCGLGYYLQYLYEQGLLGPGKQIDSAPLPMDQSDGLLSELAAAVYFFFLTAISIEAILSGLIPAQESPTYKVTKKLTLKDIYDQVQEELRNQYSIGSILRPIPAPDFGTSNFSRRMENFRSLRVQQ
jgi:hypothetical protein